MPKSEQVPSVECVSGVIKDWLNQEIADSDAGRNRVLNDFDVAINGFRSPFGMQNRPASKTLSHYNRMLGLMNIYRDPGVRADDYTAGRVLHHSLMMVAGGFRTESFLQAESPDDYMAYRHTHGPVGIDLPAAISSGLAIDLKSGDFIDATFYTNQQTRKLHHSVFEWVAENNGGELPLATPDDPPVQAMREVQRSWVELSVVHMMVAAENRGGDWVRVPLLEPKSISDVSAEPLYPFAA